ncbi:MAG: NAD(P)H-dependent oxidoreductase [Sphingomonadales bacterium]|nr:NAD(P)H-dependent oxidoreductase [Sphingomonadales bacterium]MBD3773219.1 NAD(P)H-dependent oxidoreductase [Paracoccaceae bacterium]
MNFLIVHAHPSTDSFSQAMTERATASLGAAGHAVVVSDLYRMGFDPVSDRRNFTSQFDAEHLDIQLEEKHAAQIGTFAPDLVQEMEKVAWCDVLILQFPIWWLSVPAIMKGWIDRVFACGFAYGGGRHFDSGVFRGKTALCALTLGGTAENYSDGNTYADIERVLYPIRRGVFEFLGFTALDPHPVYAPTRMDDTQRAAALDAYEARLLEIARR